MTVNTTQNNELVMKNWCANKNDDGTAYIISSTIP